jgi:hypothetical protein
MVALKPKLPEDKLMYAMCICVRLSDGEGLKVCYHCSFDSWSVRANRPPQNRLTGGKEDIAEMQISVEVQLGHDNCNSKH